MTNYLDRQLLAHFPSYAGLDDEAQNELKDAALLYTFRGIGSSALSSVFRSVLDSPVSLSLYRNALITDGYLLRNVKGFLLHAVSHKNLVSRKQAALSALAYRVESEDVPLARHVKNNKALNGILTDYVGQYKIFTLGRIDRIVADIIKDLERWAFFFARKKLTFVCRANSLDVQDIVSELVVKAVQSFLMFYPCFDSKQHALNVAKKAMHNHAINLIMHYTSQSRATLYKNEDGTFRSIKVSYDLISNLLHSDGHSSSLSDSDMMGGEGSSSGGTHSQSHFVMDDSEKAHNKIATRQLLTTTKCPKKRKFLGYLLGVYCKQFSDWLKTSRVTTVGNDEYYDRLLGKGQTDTYVNLCFRYLGIGSGEGQVYLKELKLALRG